MEKNKTIFLDRDGTINKEVNYLSTKQQLEYLPGTISALKLLASDNWQLIILTNQSGVARGLITEDQLRDIHNYMLETLKRDDIKITHIYYCPHHPDYGEKLDCDCRKPKPGMIFKAAEEFQIDLHHSYLVGDKLNDILAGQAAGLKSVLVKTGYGEKQWRENSQKAEVIPDYIFDDLLEFAKWVVKKGG